MKDYLLDRLREKSTWIGLFAVANAFGVTLTQQQETALVVLALALCGGIGIAHKE